LDEEKKFTHQRDDLSRKRRALPWVKVDAEYVFDGPNGKETLSDLFEGRNQLVVYHFMFGPNSTQGCSGCSFWADNFNGIMDHLHARDTAMVAISRAPLEKLDAFKKRMGWSFKWLSSGNTRFNYDFLVSFTPEQIENGTAVYNYRKMNGNMEDREGISTFYKDENGAIYHTYSTYARGLDLMNTAYNYLDLTAKGRDEEGSPDHPSFWLRHHDKYDTK